MYRFSTQRYGTPGFALSGLAFVAMTPAALAHEKFVQSGEAGFVVSHLEYAIGGDPVANGTCPKGLSVGWPEQAKKLPQPARLEGESDQDFRRRSQMAFRKIAAGPNGENLCGHPEVGKPDPLHYSIANSKIAVHGIDLDGKNSQGDGQCPHTDFVGMDGKPGVDNEFYRATGCVAAMQPTGAMYLDTPGSMLTGSWGILIRLTGVDDVRNDDNVDVGIFQNADPIELSPSREPLMYATYAAHQDPKFRARTKGRIVNGVLTTVPVDFTYFRDVNSIVLDATLRDARLQMTIAADGAMEGYLAGYAPAVGAYDSQFGFRNGRRTNGAPASGEGSATGFALTAGHSCTGIYYSLLEHADGHYDPKTKKCTSISMQYRIKAIPAFIADVKTKSTNEELVR
jgi:hypothetical protein